MPLYELLCIASPSAESAPLRDLVKSTSRLILDNGGMVRAVQYWGKRTLPQRARRHQQYHDSGDYFLLHFDTSPPVLFALSSRLRADPRVVKWTTLRLGVKLNELIPPGLNGGEESSNSSSFVNFKKTIPFGQDLLTDLEGSQMGEQLRKDLENEIKSAYSSSSSSSGDRVAHSDLENQWNELKDHVRKSLQEEIGDSNLKGRSLALGGTMIKEG